jgi:hypothetical protein
MKIILRLLNGMPSKKHFVALALLLGTLSYGQVTFTDSNLPIFIINTAIDPDTGNPMEIPDDPKIWADMKIIYHTDGSRNYMTDADTEEFLDYNAKIKIEVRGSSSQLLDKKQYGWTTYDSDGEKQNVSLLGMPEENDWILNGLAFDKSLMRDYINYNLTREIGQYATRTHYCEVVLNGDYRGLYILQEKIKDDSKRVNIEEITEDDNDGINLTGGYITKADKTTGGDEEDWWMESYAGWTGFIHELPKPEDATEAQTNYIHGQFTSLEATAGAGNDDLATGYPSVIDIPTFVDYMVMNEFSSNVDAYQISTFFHKDRGGKLRAGPVWDFNLSLGFDEFGDRSKTDVWQFSNGDNEGAKFWTDLFNDDTYKCYFSRRWNSLTGEGQPLSYTHIEEFIDDTTELITEAAAREQLRWGTVPDLPAEVDYIKTWITTRMEWMTNNIGSFDGCSDVTVPSLVISRIDYNPGESDEFPESDDQEFIEITNAGTTSVNLTGVYLSELGISYQFPAGSDIDAGERIYIVSNTDVFEAKYDVTAFGQFVRNMSNKSQKLVLSDGLGNLIDTVQYFDSEPWPDADGSGSYLQLISTDLDNNVAASWTANSGTSLSAVSFAEASKIVVYPNPVNDMLTIRSADVIRNVEVYDIYGKLLQSVSQGTTVTEINFSRYASGIYFVKVSNEKGSMTQKIVRQ